MKYIAAVYQSVFYVLEKLDVFKKACLVINYKDDR